MNWPALLSCVYLVAGLYLAGCHMGATVTDPATRLHLSIPKFVGSQFAIVFAWPIVAAWFVWVILGQDREERELERKADELRDVLRRPAPAPARKRPASGSGEAKTCCCAPARDTLVDVPPPPPRVGEGRPR